MESFGYKLKTAREAKDISFDQAGKDTKIAMRYLQALEKEDFTIFPGEAYITGFIRNYSAYLDLDVQELLSLYRAHKMQEQPIPVEQLLRRPSPLPKVFIGVAAIVLVLGLIGGGIAALISRPPRPDAEKPSPGTPAQYAMNGDSFERRFHIGDSMTVPDGEGQLRIELMSLTDTVTIQTPGGPISLEPLREESVMLNNGASILRISVSDYTKGNPSMGAILHFEVGAAAEDQPFIALDNEDVVPESAGLTAQSVSAVLFSSTNPYPFTLQANFQGYCMFRWEILMERDRRDRNERYFQRSDDLSIQAQNGIRVWTSNAQAAKFQVIGGGRTVPLELGAAGEVVVADIRWVREDSRYRLVVTRLES